jgi:hypothetical protein
MYLFHSSSSSLPKQLMFILLHNNVTHKESIVECRAPKSAEAARSIVMREVDRWLPANWHREYDVCSISVLQPRQQQRYYYYTTCKEMVDLGVHTWKQRCQKDSLIKACITRKSPAERADIDVRLEIALAYSYCCSSRENGLALLDALALQLVLRFAGLVG